MHEYRQKIDFICYSATIIKSDVIKAANKLTEFLINSRSEHLIDANHCIRYLHQTKHLTIKYVAFDDDELMMITNENKQMFEATVNVFFVNENERRSIEDYIFKLFEELID